MSDFTLRALNLAIGSMAFERELLLHRIETVAAEVEQAEQLSEQVLLIEQALGEFRDAYTVGREREPVYPPYEVVFAEAVRSALAVRQG
ncbi:MAG: hypothetical protein ACK5QH_17965 [Rubrivivax sp.]|jgi:hypothetical protein